MFGIRLSAAPGVMRIRVLLGVGAFTSHEGNHLACVFANPLVVDRVAVISRGIPIGSQRAHSLDLFAHDSSNGIEILAGQHDLFLPERGARKPPQVTASRRTPTHRRSSPGEPRTTLPLE